MYWFSVLYAIDTTHCKVIFLIIRMPGLLMFLCISFFHISARSVNRKQNCQLAGKHDFTILSEIGHCFPIYSVNAESMESCSVCSETGFISEQLSPVKRICVFEHSVMTNFNCACPAIQRGQGSGFLSEGSS